MELLAAGSILWVLTEDSIAKSAPAVRGGMLKTYSGKVFSKKWKQNVTEAKAELVLTQLLAQPAHADLSLACGVNYAATHLVMNFPHGALRHGRPCHLRGPLFLYH